MKWNQKVDTKQTQDRKKVATSLYQTYKWNQKVDTQQRQDWKKLQLVCTQHANESESRFITKVRSKKL